MLFLFFKKCFPTVHLNYRTQEAFQLKSQSQYHLKLSSCKQESLSQSKCLWLGFPRRRPKARICMQAVQYDSGTHTGLMHLNTINLQNILKHIFICTHIIIYFYGFYRCLCPSPKKHVLFSSSRNWPGTQHCPLGQ